ncbi:MAG: hypothetical protein DI535_23485 [Citrobacter freundii]|nr:MAG: hypothetical protein DI535_23485 [Citrobacter freundii]
MNYRLPLLASTLTIASITASSQSTVAYPKTYLQQWISKSPKLSAEEVQRFADLGKLWGVFQYFNPKVNSGAVITDSLALQPLRSLLKDHSATGFKNAVTQLLTIADDAGSQLLTETTTPATLFTTEKTPPKVFTLNDNTLFIAFPTQSADYIGDPSAIKGLMPSEWKTAKAVILDLRNATPISPYAEASFLYDVMPLIMQAVAGNKKLPAIYERRLFHNGFVSQASTNPNIYSSGFQTIAAQPYANSKSAPLDKPVAIIFDRFINIDILKQLWALREAGLCKLIFEGGQNLYPTGNTESLTLADNVTVNVRINEYQLSGNKPVPQPDLLVDHITDTSLNGAFLQRVVTLLQDKQTKPSSSITALADFVQPIPARYSDTLVPSAEQRLFGLYNFWNTIHYFSPYTAGLDHSWDSIITKYIPVFLHANDSLSYMLAVRALASETQDCHGFIGTNRQATPARKYYGAWPPLTLGYVGTKVYVSEIVKDSSQDLSKLKVGDEITQIDGMSIAALENEWRGYIPTSNENTYKRDLAFYLTTGPLNSTATLNVRRGAQAFTIDVKRNGRWNFSNSLIDFNNKHKPVELLTGNIGYINMGKLRQAQVDSVMQAFNNTKAIIFDIRNYPQGTAWSIAPKLTDNAKLAVLFDKPFVDYNHLKGGEDQSTLKSGFTVTPAGKKPYKGQVIILCDRTTQSQAEYTIMMFQGATKCTVIGSQTAGADGNVTDVVLPGGYTITFSGLGIYYPDGTPTQRRGIKVNIQSEPTIAGLLAGKDEVLDRALQFVNTGK